MAELAELELDDEGHGLGEHQGHSLGDGRGLGKVVEVAETELLLDGVLDLDLDVGALAILARLGGLASDGAVARVALNSELDARLGDGDLDGLTHGRELAADALELGRGHADDALVGRGGDAEVVGVDVHKLEVEGRDAVLLRGLEGDAQLVARLVGGQSELVVVATALKNLDEVLEVNAEVHVVVNTVVLEATRGEGELDQRNEGGVNALKGDAGGRAVKVALLNELTETLHDLNKGRSRQDE